MSEPIDKAFPIVTEFRFENKEAQSSFLDWLSNAGEQEYWMSEESDEEREAVMVKQFDIFEDNTAVNCQSSKEV